MNSLRILRILIVSAATAGLAACGGGGGGASTYTIGGTVTGLAAGTQIVLNDNGSDPLMVNSNAAFTFAKAVSANDSYAVTIATQPTGQTCSVANNRGAGVTANVTNVDITCSAVTYTIGGAVSGLAAGQLATLNNNGADALAINADGSFTFTTPVPYNGSYAVTVGTQPTGQTCTVSNGSGAGATADVASVTVNCSTNTFTIGGTVTGLAAGQQVTLDNNGADPVTVSAVGAFTFATPVAFNGSYAVTAGTQPTGQTCTVSNGSGSGVVANIANVTVTCSTNTFTIGGTVSGLAAGQQVTLKNNNADPTTVTANGAFNFATPVAFNGVYAVTVGTQPTGQTCTVSNGSGSGVVANIANVTVTCSTNTFTIGGTVSGLAAGQQVTLKNNNADPKTVTANGAFNFATPVAFNGVYAVTVGTQPTGQTCTVSNGSGSGVVANIANVTVTCSTNTFTIGGTVSGLAAGQQVTLKNNNADPKTVTANGAFNFATPVTFNGVYAVTVGTQPTGQTCTVSNGSGSGVVANIANVTVTCSTNTYTIGITVSGLAAGQQVTLNNNGSDPLTVLAAQNGVLQTFSMPVTFNGSYAVTVGTQPTGQTCTVSNGSGSGVVANIANVTVTCSTNTFTIGGTVSGLAAGQQVTLKNNNADPTTVTANGAFNFATPVAFNGVYAVTVGTQPTGQTCTVSNGSGSGVVANIANVTVTCSTNTFTIGGTVSGLAAGQQVTLKNNNADPTTVTANGAFNFATPVAFNGVYAVTVGTQPTGQTCTVSNGSGSGVVANIANVTVTCSTNTFTIGGTVSGLAAGQQVTLKNNNADPTTVTANGAFNFATPVAFNGVYAVTVGTQPTGQTCTVSNGSGSGVVANIANVTVTCSTNTFTIGGTVSGLAAGQQVTLKNNNADPTTVTANGAFNFATPVAFNGVYAVTVGTQPTGQTCTVSNGSGSGVVANIANVTVTCSTNTYTIGGTISGLVSTQQVTLNNNGSDPLIVTVASGGTFTFTTPVAYNTGYAVTVGTQPTAETCRITNGTGSNVTANVTNVSITCRLALAYVTNATDNTISQYSIGVDGALIPLGTSIATGTNPNVVTVDPTGRFAYVANFGSDTVSQYAIGATGELVSLGPVATGTSPYSVVIDSTGRYAYVTNQGSDSVSQFTVGSDGMLTPMSTASVPTGSHPYGVTIDPSGRYVYVANHGIDSARGTTVSQYTIDGTGALVPMAAPVVTVGSGPLSITVNPAGTYAYVANFWDLTVSQLTIDGTGSLALVATVPAGDGPYPVTITPTGQYAYYSNKYDDQIAQCVFATGGALDCSAGLVGTGVQPQYLAVDPFGLHVYAVNYNIGGAGTISQYSIGAGGLLTPIGGAAPTTGAGPFAIATTR